MGCFDSAITLVYKAEKLFGDFIGNGKQLKEFCSLVDKTAEEAEAEFIEVTVDEIYGNLTFSFVCDDVIIDRENNTFVKLCDMVNSVKFSKSGKMLKIELILCGLWSGLDE